MKMHVENLAKIASADFEFNGITVIVGNNNTGKSTVGKILYAVFNSLINFKERIELDRYKSCMSVLSDVMPRSFRRPFKNMRKEGDVITDFLSRKKNDDDIRYVIDTLARSRGVEVDTFKIMEALKEIRNPSDVVMRNRLIRNYFNSVFNGQYISFFNPQKGALVDLTVQGANIRILLRKRSTTYKANLEIQHPAYYIDSPNLLHAINYNDFGASSLSLPLAEAIRSGIGKSRAPRLSVVSDVTTDAKLQTIYDLVGSVLKGSLDVDDTGEVVLKQGKLQGFKREFDMDIGNMSQGLKSFGLLLAAIKFGALKRKDVVILDEPEIHLHPDWQIRYAELIVLIQKTFDLTVLLTSHSADFIQAIRLFSKKYGTFSTVNAYISSESENGRAVFDIVPHDDWDGVFAKFEPAFDMLVAVESEVEGLHHG